MRSIVERPLIVSSTGRCRTDCFRRRQGAHLVSHRPIPMLALVPHSQQGRVAAINEVDDADVSIAGMVPVQAPGILLQSALQFDPRLSVTEAIPGSLDDRATDETGSLTITTRWKTENQGKLKGVFRTHSAPMPGAAAPPPSALDALPLKLRPCRPLFLRFSSRLYEASAAGARGVRDAKPCTNCPKFGEWRPARAQGNSQPDIWTVTF